MLQTPQILAEFAKILSQDAHESYSPSPASTSFHTHKNHPDVKYFRSIKDKNHFNFHSLKRADRRTLQTRTESHPDTTISVNHSNFDPLDRDLLMKRIATFNVLNWNVPSIETNLILRLNELTCSLSGWRCREQRNTLECTFCHLRLKLTFHELGDPSIPFDFNASDLDELNQSLMEGYITQIETSSHEANCMWRLFKTPADGIYYPVPHTVETNEHLISEYLSNIKELLQNSTLINSYKSIFKSSLVDEVSLVASRPEVIAQTNQLLKQYFPENLENFEAKTVLTWVYQIALLGWSLRVQTFTNQLVLLIYCKKCNARVYLQKPSSVDGATLNPFAKTRHLTPCAYPVAAQLDNELSIYEEPYVDEKDLKINLFEEHKPWCCSVHRIGGKSEEQYLVEILTTQEQNSGIKRKHGDLNERLRKIRKFTSTT